MKVNWEKYLVYSLFTILLTIFLIILFRTQNSFGGGDHFGHFRLAYWGWKYPEMLFNHWGKPAFTLLISPFAQFGINGARLYNVIMGLLTAFFTWKLAKHFKFNHSWIVIILVLFTPIYFVLMFTSLTEVTFSFFLVFSIFLFFKDKAIYSAIVLSFLPLVRTEGIILIPLFILAWSLKRQFRAIPFLGVGFVIISLLGMPYYESFWWQITEMPYSSSAKDIYGSGPLLHFVNNNPSILGSFLGVMFIVGSITMLKKWTLKKRFKIEDSFYFILLIIGSFVIFFMAHSFVWWKGIGNSLGLIRVIGSVTPLAALTAMAGVSLLFDYKNKWWTAFSIILLLIVGYRFIDEGTHKHSYGFRISMPQQLIKEAADFLIKHGLNKHKIYYYNGYLSQIMNFDPRSQQTSQKYLPQNDFFIASVPDSSIIVWDAHFGPNEGRMPLEKLEQQEDLRVLKVIKPKKSFTVLGGHDYQIVIFQKDLSLKSKLRYSYIDFETSGNGSEEDTYSGLKSFKLGPNMKYKTFLDVIFQEVSDTMNPSTIDVSLAYKVLDPNSKPTLIVCSLESQNEVVYNSNRDLLFDKTKSNLWQTQTFKFELPRPKTVNDRLKIYIWNRNGSEMFIDDVVISLQPKNN